MTLIFEFCLRGTWLAEKREVNQQEERTRASVESSGSLIFLLLFTRAHTFIRIFLLRRRVLLCSTVAVVSVALERASPTHTSPLRVACGWHGWRRQASRELPLLSIAATCRVEVVSPLVAHLPTMSSSSPLSSFLESPVEVCSDGPVIDHSSCE